MNADGTILRVLLHGTTHYMIPLFQRTYSWDKKNWVSLWTDILETYQGETETRHFLGSIVSKSLPSTPEGVSRFLVIDGQQRLTTLTILLAALRDSARAADPKLADKLHDLYLTNEYASGFDCYKLLPTQADRSSYFAVIDGTAAQQPDTLVHQAYDFFREQLVKPDHDGAALDFKRLEQILMGGFEIVSITLGDQDNEYRIFESLNATGAPLTQADLLRNYLFMHIPVADQDEVYHSHWLPLQTSLGASLEDFFRYQYMSEVGFVREGDVYQSWKKILDKLTSEELIARLTLIAKDAGFYRRLIAPESEPQPSIAAGLHRLNRWGGQTMYPFLLNVYRWYAKNELDATGFVAILQMIESFLVRRLFARVPTNQLNRLFIRLANQLPEGYNRADGTLVALSDPGRRWPKDQLFKDAILQYPLYSDSRPDQRRLVLEALERDFQHKEPPSFSGATIEHIMPQTLTDEWRVALGDSADDDHGRLLHVLGNLTLSAYNSELSNDPFELKRERLATSNFELNKDVAAESAWTASQIEARGKRLAEKAVRIWPGPIETAQLDTAAAPDLSDTSPGDSVPPPP